MPFITQVLSTSSTCWPAMSLPASWGPLTLACLLSPSKSAPHLENARLASWLRLSGTLSQLWCVMLPPSLALNQLSRPTCSLLLSMLLNLISAISCCVAATISCIMLLSCIMHFPLYLMYYAFFTVLFYAFFYTVYQVLCISLYLKVLWIFLLLLHLVKRFVMVVHYERRYIK